MKTQCVIIGGGGAGLSAAIAASENGVQSVLVLEKRSSLGGNTALATGMFACESPVQERERIIADKDELFKRAVKWAHLDKVDPRIIRAFINKSGDTIRWLENMGLEFRIVPFVPNQQPRIWHCPEGRGVKLTRILAEKCREHGVEFLLDTGAKKILRDDEGRITGVIAEQKGNSVEITSRCVVITTGGFGGNQRLLKQYCPSYYEQMPLRGLPLEGDGISLAGEAGGAIEEFATLLKEGPRVALNTWPLMHLEKSPATLWVNSLGRRFVDESAGDYPFESVNAILRQPDRKCYTLLDSTIRRHYENSKPGLKSALRDQVSESRVKIANSWEEIASWIGADSEVLSHTIDVYNGFCDHGYDTDFAKERRFLIPLIEAPYYAIRNMAVFLDTIGGIRINEQMAVLDHMRRPIPGFFAAGVITSGWMSDTYCGDLSGSAFGYAINSGRIAGEYAAEFIQG